MLLSQHRVSSSKIVRSRAPFGARYMGHTIKTWSPVCSKVPHSQFGEGARLYLCMDKWNRRQQSAGGLGLALTQAVRGKLIPTGLALVFDIKTWSLKYFHSIPFMIFPLRSADAKSGKEDSAHLAQMGVWILVSVGEYLKNHLKDHTKYDQDPEIHGKPRRVSLPVGKARLAGCLRVWISGPLKWDADIQ